MRFNVRVVSGGGGGILTTGDVEADLSSDSVASLKSKVETVLRLAPGTEQKLVYKGKTLQGEAVVAARSLNVLLPASLLQTAPASKTTS